MVPACFNELNRYRDIFCLKKEINLSDIVEDGIKSICEEIVVNKETDDYDNITNNKNKFDSEEFEYFDIHRYYDYIYPEFTQKKSGSVEELNSNIEDGLKEPIYKIIEESADLDFKNHNYNLFAEIDYDFLFGEITNES